MPTKDLYCSFCGTFHVDASHPKQCRVCKQFTYVNPIPVVCAVVPIYEMTKIEFAGENTRWVPEWKGVLTVRRGINPCKGEICLPGGFMDDGEGPGEAAAREVFEETGVSIEASNFELLTGGGFKPVIKSPSSSNLLIFMTTRIGVVHRGPFHHDHEVLEVLLAQKAQELCWSSHTAALKTYFDKGPPYV